MRNLFGSSTRTPPCWFAGNEQSSFAYAASSAADGVVSTAAVPVPAEGDADGLADATGEVAADGELDADAELDADVDPGPALAAARTNPAGSAWRAGCPPGTPRAFGLDDGAADADGVGVAAGDTDVDGVADGDPEVDGVADGDPELDGVADGDPEAGADELVAVGVVSATSVPLMPLLLSYTCRMLSSAVSPMFLSTPWVSLPGTEMTMSLPSTFTSALLTPRLFTRFDRMFFAVLRSALLTLRPTVDFGSRVTVVPPRRSRPSAGE